VPSFVNVVQYVPLDLAKVPVVWYFAGFDSPALDIRFDDTPPQSIGAILVQVPLFSSETGEAESVSEQRRRFAEQIQERYRDQGITARDLTRMTAEDLLADITIGAVRDRPDSEIPEGSRGTIQNVQATRVLDNTCVPVEPIP